jgi:hypothetical protein
MSLNVDNLLCKSINIFQINLEHIDAFVRSWNEFLKLRRVMSGVVAVATIHEQQFTLPYYSGIGAPSGVASAARKNGSDRVKVGSIE